MTVPPRKSTPSYQRHPLSAVWPDLEPQAREALRESMHTRGYDPLEPVVLYEGKVLDGWHRYSMARALGIEVTTVAFDGDDPAGWVIARHTGRRSLSPRDRAHCVVRCREWASTGRPAHGRERPRDCDAGVPERRSSGRLSGRPSTTRELAAEADVSERTIRRAKAQVRAKDKHADASAAGGEQQPLRPAGNASGDPIPQSQAGGRLEASRAGVQPAAAIPGDETQAPTVDTEPVAVSDADRIRSKPAAAKGSGVAAVVDADAPTRRAGAEREAPASRQREPEDGNRQPAGPPVRAGAGAMEAPDVSARSDSGSDSSLRNESLVTLGREAGSATVGLGSTEPAAERATGRSERSSSLAYAKTVMASPEAPASSNGGSGSPSEWEVVEMSTAGATDSQAHRLIASEPGGTEAADPAGGCTPSDSASSSDSRSSGSTPPAVRERASGDADASADPAPLSPAPAAVAGREAADAHAEGVAVATAAQTACDTDVELRRCLGELRSAAARLGAVSRVGPPSSFEATCGLVQALVAAMERCLETGLEEQVVLAGLPADLVRRLDAHMSNETVMAASTQQTGDAGGRGRGSAPLEQASNPRAWLKKRFGI
ncbi:MAG: hypothetical protein OXG04_27030 [Acidobacteria bacterium]|nr:hypothetical protein [Acidobacteriota bacterium]